MDSYRFFLTIKTHKKHLSNRSLKRLADALAKLEAFDRALLGQTSVPISVRHFLYPRFSDQTWTVEIIVQLSMKEDEFDFLPADAHQRIHQYLNESRPLIIDRLFPAQNISQVDQVTSDISKHAKNLSSDLKQQFLPQHHKLLRNLCDLSSTSTVDRFKYNYSQFDNKTLNDEDFFSVNEDLKKVLLEVKSIATESYEKILQIGSPNFSKNKYRKWIFDCNLSRGYYIMDFDWLELVYDGTVIIKPGCSLHVTISFGPVGPRNIEQHYISKVHNVKEPLIVQYSLPI